MLNDLAAYKAVKKLFDDNKLDYILEKNESIYNLQFSNKNFNGLRCVFPHLRPYYVHGSYTGDKIMYNYKNQNYRKTFRNFKSFANNNANEALTELSKFLIIYDIYEMHDARIGLGMRYFHNKICTQVSVGISTSHMITEIYYDKVLFELSKDFIYCENKEDNLQFLDYIQDNFDDEIVKYLNKPYKLLLKPNIGMIIVRKEKPDIKYKISDITDKGNCIHAFDITYNSKIINKLFDILITLRKDGSWVTSGENSKDKNEIWTIIE